VCVGRRAIEHRQRSVDAAISPFEIVEREPDRRARERRIQFCRDPGRLGQRHRQRIARADRDVHRLGQLLVRHFELTGLLGKLLRAVGQLVRSLFEGRVRRADTRRHVVECSTERPHLIGAVLGDASRVIAGADRRGGAGELSEGSR